MTVIVFMACYSQLMVSACAYLDKLHRFMPLLTWLIDEISNINSTPEHTFIASDETRCNLRHDLTSYTTMIFCIINCGYLL